MGDASDDNGRQQPAHRRRPSWASTLAAQACLCLALFATVRFLIRRPLSSGGARSAPDVYFLSVRGGSRPAIEQRRLLQQMDTAARVFNVKFVVDVSEFGDADPLLQNAARDFPTLKVPWYVTTTNTSATNQDAIFVKEITISNERDLDIIVLNTGLWQNVTHIKNVNESSSGQLAWLKRKLAMSSNNWRIIVGFHPLVNCEEEPNKTEIMKYHDQVHGLFTRHRVDMYLSGVGCAGHFSRQSGTTHIGNPGRSSEEFREPSTSANINSEIGNSFVVHRVSPLEIESYSINSSGDTISKHTHRPWGREVM